MRPVLVFLMILLCHTHTFSAEGAFTYLVNDPGAAKGLRLVEDPAALCRVDSVDGMRVIAPPANPDYFVRTGITFRVDESFPAGAAEAFLIIDHLDRNIGLIEVRFDADRPDNPKRPGGNPAYASASDGAGVACLGTGKPRRAIFRLGKPAFQHRQKLGCDIWIAGVRSLTGVSLSTALDEGEWERGRRDIPTGLEPRVSLSNPMQLVMSVGADARTLDGLPRAMDHMRERCPIAKVLGFNGVESYVKWNFAEPEQGRFDWSFYDAIVNQAAEYGLKWFPLLIVGSAYTLPEWYYESEENEGFACLEHGQGNDIQTIFCENQTPHVNRFLREFGAHYEPMGALLGVRLGPSGNYGESQYPAGGNWGYKWGKQHIHIGWWAGDRHAAPHFRQYLKKKYPTIEDLNRAWGEQFTSFDEIQTFIPQFAETKRKRKDFADWYMWAMTDWCEKWAIWARESMPSTDIYQSAGGWGFVESGTDFTDQTRSMARVQGGIRATNETDSYAQNFYATRMMSSAARFYGVPFGTEPAGYGSARGMVARIFNVLVNNGQHLFFYSPNLLNLDHAVDKWLELAPLLDQRGEPFIEVAALYPDTKSKLDDGVFRHLYSFSFNQRVAALRPHLDFDFCSERMILDGALPRYKVLLFLWSDVVEAEVLDRIDRWVREGGTVIYPYWGRMSLSTVEGDYAVYNRWLRGETGMGRVIFDRGDREPPHRYGDFIVKRLLDMPDLDPRTHRMLRVKKPPEVYVSVLKDGTMAALNYNDDTVEISVPGVGKISIGPYSIRMITNL